MSRQQTSRTTSPEPRLPRRLAAEAFGTFVLVLGGCGAAVLAGDASPAGYAWWAAALVEVLLTALFVLTILGVTDRRAPQGFAPVAIGLGLTLIHLVSIPVDNTSVNPARSIGPALFAGGTAVEQLWLFVLAPLLGAAIAGALYAPLFGRQRDDAADPVPAGA